MAQIASRLSDPGDPGPTRPMPKRNSGGGCAIARSGASKFVRQEPVGPYVCDFICRERRLIVEVDGGQHVDSAADKKRDQWPVAHNYRVMRFWNNDVLKNIEGVLETIFVAINRESPSPDLSSADRPLPAGGER